MISKYVYVGGYRPSDNSGVIYRRIGSESWEVYETFAPNIIPAQIVGYFSEGHHYFYFILQNGEIRRSKDGAPSEVVFTDPAMPAWNAWPVDGGNDGLGYYPYCNWDGNFVGFVYRNTSGSPVFYAYKAGFGWKRCTLANASYVTAVSHNAFAAVGNGHNRCADVWNDAWGPQIGWPSSVLFYADGYYWMMNPPGGPGTNDWFRGTSYTTMAAYSGSQFGFTRPLYGWPWVNPANQNIYITSGEWSGGWGNEPYLYMRKSGVWSRVPWNDGESYNLALWHISGIDDEHIYFASRRAANHFMSYNGSSMSTPISIAANFVPVGIYAGGDTRLDQPALDDLPGSDVSSLALSSEVALAPIAGSLDFPATPWAHIYLGVADLEAPILSGQVPAPNAEGVALTASICLTITDPAGGAGLNAQSIVLKVAGVTAWQDDTAQPGFTVIKTAIPYGFTYTITADEPFDYLMWIIIDVYAEDAATIPNVLDTSYTFKTEARPPEIVFIYPQHNATDVSPTPEIKFIVKDINGGDINVDTSTLLARINNKNIFSNGYAALDWSVVFTMQDPTSYLVLMTPALAARLSHNQEISMTITCSNTEGKLCVASLAFTIEPKPFTFSISKFLMKAMRKI